MKKTPILFTPLMVKAIIALKKTQTRRMKGLKELNENPDKWQPTGNGELWNTVLSSSLNFPHFEFEHVDTGQIYHVMSQYGSPGDRLWVKETFFAWGFWELLSTGKWRFVDCTLSRSIDYRYLDNPPINVRSGYQNVRAFYKRPSLFMPRIASRINLKIEDIRMQRLQDITEEEAIAEGVGFGFQCNGGWPDYEHISKSGQSKVTQDTARMSFASIFDSINGAGSWERNPWLFAIKFKKE